MEKDTKEHIELEYFFKLLSETPLSDITYAKSAYRQLLKEVKIPFCFLKITYTNIRTIYEIEYKGVRIIESEIKNEDYIHDQVHDILGGLKKVIKNEFYSKYKTK